MWRAGCNMQGGGSSRAVGSQPTWDNVCFPQGQIPAVLLLELTSASTSWSLWASLLPISLKLIFWPWGWRLQFISQWCPGGPACLEKASPARVWAGLLRAVRLPLGKTYCPSTRMGKGVCSTHRRRGTTHGAGERRAPNHRRGGCSRFVWGLTQKCRGVDPWAGGSWGLLSIAQQPSVKHEGSITDENVAVRLFRHCRIKERPARKSEVLPFGGRHGSEGSKWFCGSSPWGLSKVAVLLIMQFFTGIQKMREFGIFLPALPAFILWQDQPCVNSLSPMVFA